MVRWRAKFSQLAWTVVSVVLDPSRTVLKYFMKVLRLTD